jgi:bis(5'-nucleosidyl)-tetraphosphatase
MSTDDQRTPNLSAGVVIAHAAANEYRYLLLRSFRYWDFPKGMVEPDESPFAAAQREAREEANLSNLDFRWGEIYRETEPYARGKVARYYLALSRSMDVTLPVSAELGKPEHDEYRWVNYAAAKSLVVPRVAAVLDWAHALITASR